MRQDTEAAREEAAELPGQLTHELDVAKIQIAALEATVASANTDTGALREQLTAASERATTAEARTDELRAELDCARQEAHQVREESAKVREESVVLRGRLEALESIAGRARGKTDSAMMNSRSCVFWLCKNRYFRGLP